MVALVGHGISKLKHEQLYQTIEESVLNSFLSLITKRPSGYIYICIDQEINLFSKPRQ